ncbi:MAG: hypothetical protein R3250_04040 [Melioribacteraceae bacterium]|nr:hypothetical protein [Melioribacteraceae bacterium]
MNFKEQFPSLRNFDVDCSDIIYTKSTHDLVMRCLTRFQKEIESQLKEHCLDKQKVKEIISMKIIPNISREIGLSSESRWKLNKEILTELGLED